MTNERHEKALEAAAAAGDKVPGMSCFRNMADRDRAWVSEIISKYLSEMDAVIVPREPTDETVSAFMAGKFEDGDNPTLIKSIYRRIISSAPNHFTNGE